LITLVNSPDHALLAALYPAIPVLLAFMFLRERATATQLAGLGIGAVAIAIIAAG
jgi:drug/metabolite transporter (DMT)-like permease